VREVVEARERLPRWPRVSVLCPAYNQVDLIRRCVESVLSQETSLDYEIVIRDDGSTDGSQEVLRELHRQHPNRIRLILESKNLYPSVRPYSILLPAARGEYFAHCDGDDFWTSTNKIQLCVEALDNDPTLILVGHLATFELSHPLNNGCSEGRTFGQSGRYVRGEIPRLHMSSMVGRKQPFLDRWFSWPDIKAGDMKLKVIAAEAGETLVLPYAMTTIGHDSGGMWQSLSDRERSYISLRTYVELFDRTDLSRDHFTREYTTIAQSTIRSYRASGERLGALRLWIRWFLAIKSWRSKIRLLRLSKLSW